MLKNKRLSTAPMIDWTLPEYLYLARLCNPEAYVYSEMISTSAILNGDTARLLRLYERTHPVVLQLGGSDPKALATCARLGAAAGFDEINLNVGCPSDRVQYYEIGACLMAYPKRVGQMVAAMQAAVDVPVTVKHRIGIDEFDSYAFMRDFVGEVAAAGCRHVIVHARIAWLQGLSPKQNREIPPLRYAEVYRLKRDFPDLLVEINGGITTLDAISEHLQHVDGVMIGREAYHNPYILAQAMTLWGKTPPTRAQVFNGWLEFLADCERRDMPLNLVVRHGLGLFQGLAGARKWRQALSGQKSLTLSQIQAAGEAVLRQNDLL